MLRSVFSRMTIILCGVAKALHSIYSLSHVANHSRALFSRGRFIPMLEHGGGGVINNDGLVIQRYATLY